MEKASRNQTIFSSKPLGVTAWIFLENGFVNPLNTVSMYWRIGLPKNASHAGIGRLEFFLRWAFRCKNRPLLQAAATKDTVITSAMVKWTWGSSRWFLAFKNSSHRQ